jgi:CDP-6-deoxy-D-xylo-4-hexulose-3-dehydrase
MIRLIKSSFYKEWEIKPKLAEFILKTEILSMSEECRKFEESFAKKQGRKHAVFVTSGSGANLVLIQALLNLGKLNKGDRVGFSSLTWSTNVMPLIQLGLVPVALDCNLETINVSPTEVENKISGLKALFLTNVLGFCDNIKRIKEICQEKDVIFLEDNCESMGSRFEGTMLGNFSLASTFSFFVGHHLSTIEGGMICTDDDDLHKMLLITRIHGWDRNLDTASQQELRNSNDIDDFHAKYTFYDLAYNARPTEINGFLGNAQMNYWDEIVLKREGNYKLYQYVLSQNDDFQQMKFSHMDLVSNFAMPVICRNKEAFEKYRDRFMAGNVEIRPIVAGNIAQQPFFKKYVKEMVNCPNSDIVHELGFYFPNNPELTTDELGIICDMLKK